MESVANHSTAMFLPVGNSPFALCLSHSRHGDTSAPHPPFCGVSIGQLLPPSNSLSHTHTHTHCQRNPCALQKAQIFRAELHECLIQQLHCFYLFIYYFPVSFVFQSHPSLDLHISSFWLSPSHLWVWS